MGGAEQGHAAEGRHLACTQSSVLLRLVRRLLGEDGLSELLELAGSTRTVAYLDDTTNWISLDESLALFKAAAELTGDAQIARRIGEEAVAQHAGTPVATLLRSLGSPEEVYRQITLTASKFTTITDLEPLEVEPGHAVIRSRVHEGFERTREHCDWAQGLLSQPTVLFGLPPATVEETTCQARGDEACTYEVAWDAQLAAERSDPVEHIAALESQLSAMTERLESVYATATDLIADTDLDSVLARITERAATAVRAPRYLLAVRPDDEADLRSHHSGFDEAEARRLAEQLLDTPAEELPSTWLVADVSSERRRYGRLVAMSDSNFFPQERYLLELYARYAATALDGATALDEAKRGHEEAEALLALARSLAEANTSHEVAERLADAVPAVVDCDRVSVWGWDGDAGALTCLAISGVAITETPLEQISADQTPSIPDQLASPNTEPLFYDRNSNDDFVHDILRRYGMAAMVVAPIVARGEFLGALAVQVTEDASRLELSRALRDRLSGVVAQAASALQTARLLERMSHQASHDGLTGLANRGLFTERMEQAMAAADRSGRPVGLFFVDLDCFKAVNDEWGHAVGDELLRQVAARLLETVRAGDTVARLGGDEFAIILSDVSGPDEVDAAAGRGTSRGGRALHALCGHRAVAVLRAPAARARARVHPR
ncbi:MAG TPA: diguanylate cyclase, partial [Solirubrobacteraceae bacterium]|nr:diguanylate cyclase [Solirubrobacteraceae bacterium]